MDRGNPHQYTREWWLARRGKLTSSRIKTVVHGRPRGQLTLMERLRLEELSDEVLEPDLEHIPAIAHGRKYEPMARAEAELILGDEFELVGFQTHPRYQYLGCSSDALGPDRGYNVEIKCPLDLARHMAVYNSKQLPQQHWPQIQCQMAVWEVDLTAFVSYHPDAPHWKMRTVILKIHRDLSYVDRMFECTERFMAQLRGEHKAPTFRAPVPKLF